MSFERGNRLYNNGHYEQAINEYIESIYLILMFCRNENINRDIFVFNKDRMTIQPID